MEMWNKFIPWNGCVFCVCACVLLGMSCVFNYYIKHCLCIEYQTSNLHWRPKVDGSVDQVVGALTCPVCLELPRHLPVPVCHNGHTVCLTCSRNGLGHCPVCRCFTLQSSCQNCLLVYFARCKLASLMVFFRDPQPRGVSLLAGRLIQVVPHRCPHQPCNKVYGLPRHSTLCQIHTRYRLMSL